MLWRLENAGRRIPRPAQTALRSNLSQHSTVGTKRKREREREREEKRGRERERDIERENSSLENICLLQENDSTAAGDRGGLNELQLQLPLPLFFSVSLFF